MSFPDIHKTFAMGDRVQKKSGSQWHGYVVGWYSTKLTPEGYAVESSSERGSVQIYPVAALELVERAEPIPLAQKRESSYEPWRYCRNCVNANGMGEPAILSLCGQCQPTSRGGSLYIKRAR
jgi:dihydrofolate reductase (trimethoprim resistance protein)